MNHIQKSFHERRRCSESLIFIFTLSKQIECIIYHIYRNDPVELGIHSHIFFVNLQPKNKGQTIHAKYNFRYVLFAKTYLNTRRD